MHGWGGAPKTRLKCADDSCAPQEVTLGGELRAISYGNMTRMLKGSELGLDQQGVIRGDNPATCCSACKNLDFCNTWVLCNRDSCGAQGSCSAADTSKVAADREARPTPVFEAYSGTSPVTFGTSFSPYRKCNKDGTWPYGTCILKLQENPSKSTPGIGEWGGHGCLR